jgi:hypothetical protein
MVCQTVPLSAAKSYKISIRPSLRAMCAVLDRRPSGNWDGYAPNRVRVPFAVAISSGMLHFTLISRDKEIGLGEAALKPSSLH